MPRLRPFVLHFTVIVLALLSTPANAQTSWSVPRFGDPSALLQAATRAKPKEGTDVIVLDEEDEYAFDTSGKAVHTGYLVYKVLTQQGISGWDSIEASWNPWHEERPALRVRVVAPDGAIHPLDPKTITDAPARDSEDNVYGDSRVVRAPLPAVSVGSIVEQELILRESAPFFGAGVVERVFFGRAVPVQRAMLILDAPSGLPVRYAVALMPDMVPQRVEQNGRVRTTFERGPTDALDEVENYLPSDAPAQPHVAFSTGESWQSVARGYSAIVEEKTAAKEVQSLVTGLTAGKASREDKAAAIVAYLNHEIRYTGVEFGDAAIVPHAPAETLKHKYGDCKDKSTLAVAMLRAAGIPANVALLSAGSRQDVPPDLPGMGLFDHAIVYASGSPDLWIDVTDEYARLGQIPASDQGRLALVAAPGTTALLKVPEASSKENLTVETREFYLAENGPARVVETTEPGGVFESGFRSTYSNGDNKENRKSLTDYIEEQYLTKKLDRIERSDPADFSKQFRLVVRASAAKRASTELENATAAIRIESLFSRLPGDLQQREKEPNKDADPTRDKIQKPRTADYQLPEAFVYEWHYKIVPPPGFQPKPLPANVSTKLGPATLTEEFSKDDEGTVRALFRFDTAKRRMTAAEGAALREGVAKLREGQAILVYFEPKAQALLDQGKAREAFQITRELIAQHPKETVYRLRRAKQLLAAGMGQAAREEAQAAVRLEPGSSLAQKTLAEILEHDLVGRKFRRGSEYSGAEAAFRAAKKLDPDDHEVVGNFAIFLEYNHEGERYGPGAKLKESVAEYRSLKEQELGEIGLKNNLAYALFYAGDFAEAKEYAQSLNPQIHSVVVASEAALHGVDAASAEARKRSTAESDLKTLLKTSGEMLTRARRYSLAAALMEAGAYGDNASQTMGMAALLRKAQIHEQMKLDDTPGGLITRMFLTTLEADLTLERFKVLHSRNALKVLASSDPEDVEQTLRVGRVTRNALARAGYPADVMLDLVLPAFQMRVDGDDSTAYRVTLLPANGNKIVTYVVKEGGHYKILDSANKPNSIGLEILDRLQAGDATSAQLMLDWIRDEQHLAGGDDPLAGYVFPRFWTKGKAVDPEQMKLAAAALLAQTPETARAALPILEPAKAAAKDDSERLNLSLALLNAYAGAEDFEKEHTIAAELARQHPESKRVFAADQAALRNLGRFAEAETAAQDMAKRFPDDLPVLREPIYTAVFRGDYAEAHQLEKKLIALGKAESSDLNSLAWNSLFAGATTTEDLDAVTRGSQNSQNNAAILHTLGCVYAELGKTRQAREVLIQAMGILSIDEPNNEYWYGFGRIAEQYGEVKIAHAMYEHAHKPGKAYRIPGSSYQLAQLRLTAMRSDAIKTP